MSSLSADESTSGKQNLSVLVAPHLPFLRRYARALCGSQRSGDAYVASVLEALIADRTVMDLSLSPKLGLYRLFQEIWQRSSQGADIAREQPAANAALKVARMTPRSRQLLLLTTVEDFSLEEAATVMSIGLDEAQMLADAARRELNEQTKGRVMIIEDEPIIALDLESIVSGMGHQVVGIADTHKRAVALATRETPDLILADIQLADGSSGIEAVEEILTVGEVPVIFITAYPERLLTGERPEPTFLVTKPFRPETVEAAISQVLFHASGR